MNNHQRWPLSIDGRRYLLTAEVREPVRGSGASSALFVSLDRLVIAHNLAVPAAGLEIEIPVGSRRLRLRVNPARGHLLSLVL